MNLKIIENPDRETFVKTTVALKNNNGYCPCLIDRTENSKCICIDFKFQSTTGKCHCGRYVKVPQYYTQEELQEILNK